MLNLRNQSDEAYEFTSYLATLCFTNEIYADLSRHANWRTGFDMCLFGDVRNSVHEKVPEFREIPRNFT